MCQTSDEQENLSLQKNQQRRSFLKMAVASSLGLGITATDRVMATSGVIKTSPQPENVLTPEAALERLMAGNERYVTGLSTPLNFKLERAALVSGQNPYASILSCSDSRVSPEFCFDEQRGDLFVARVAGNYLTTDFVATLEYATFVLHTPLIMVLGHESCGAIQAAIDAVDNSAQFPGHIQSIASAIAPAVRAIDKQSKNRIDDVVKMNVIQNVQELKKQTPLLNRLVAEKKLLVVGGVYNLKTGKVDMVA
ncbi:carbonic anhydrase [Nitrosomonas sp.]|uniref:carbonic anhydrase n=1 Tax=Nitrosomonas sp. TaxID=42353 RepID=UPI0025D756A4|nr:carbonic anhydrase [Nitrosomonas sp.]